MAIVLRIMCWNVATGDRNGKAPVNSALPEIADHIRAKSPDVVLLQEVVNYDLAAGGWLGGNVIQAQRLQELVGMPHCQWFDVVQLGLTGHKAVVVMSRYPLGTPRRHPIMRGAEPTGMGTLETTITINDVVHHIFSTRFDVHYNTPALQQSIDLVQGLDHNLPVIFGGDFNVSLSASPQFVDFSHNSGLINAYYEHPDPSACTDDPNQVIDHIFYRGPYIITQMELRCPFVWIGGAPVSDHPWVFVELTTPPGNSGAVYGATIRLKHLPTVGGLHSHPHNYGHPGSSGQQQITAYGGIDYNDYWRLKGAHGSPNGFRAGQPIIHGEVIRLEHVATTRNLHSHIDVPSPVTGQQEVTCFGLNGSGDENDNWRVEVEGGGPWTFGKRARLIHVLSGHALHSHAGYSHPQWTMGQQEVTCYAGRDDNDWWYLTEIQAPALNAAEFVSQTVLPIMSPRGRQTVSVTFRNTGTATWEPNQGYFLGSQAPQDNQNWGRHRSLPLATTVPPGAEYTFSFPITAPPTVGDVNFQWKMVQETVEWFGQESPLVRIGIRPLRTCDWYKQQIDALTTNIAEREELLSTGNPGQDARIRRAIEGLKKELSTMRDEARARGCIA